MNRNKKTLILILVLLILCTGISISYAFFKVSGSNNGKTVATINGAPLCMSLQLNVNSISITNEYAVPISDTKALSSDIYKTTLTIENKCATAQSFNLLLVPGPNNTMPINALKYVLVESGVATPTNGTIVSDAYSLDSTIIKQLSQATKNTSFNFKSGYLTGSGSISASTTKTYNLYLWIDENEGGLGNNSTMNKALSAYLALATGTTVGEEIIATSNLYSTIENRYKLGNSFVKKYGESYGEDGADEYTNPVYYFNGAVEDNNVLFAGFCWKIVRTTDTGGVKMIYNGVQKDFTEDYTLLNQTEYKNLNNTSTYPYTFDSTNKTWTSTNKWSNSSSISFTVPSNGDYVLNYDLSMYDYYENMYVEIFKDDVVQRRYSGSLVGQIGFNDLNTSNVIKIVFTRTSSIASGRDNIIFSFGKTNHITKSCNNTGYDSQLLYKKEYASESTSLANVGYMYNTVYNIEKKFLINQLYFTGTKAYADSVTYDSSTGKYTLDSTTAKTLSVTTSNGSTLIGKYTCNQSTTTATCSTVYYIVDYSSNYINYYSLTSGDLNINNKGSNYAFGSTFTYANGTYTLSDTTTINTDDWATKKTTISNYHYTCLTSDTTCTSLYYVYYVNTSLSNGSVYYIILSNGKSVDDALNEMLYADDVNAHDSTIKAYIDDWYKSNMTSYTDKLEDTVFCNDRTISNKNGWNPNGGSVTSELRFKNYDTNYSLACTNVTDRFSVSNNKAKLTYPVGLLTAPEVLLAYRAANYSTYYLKTGKYYWLVSPNDFDLVSINEVFADGRLGRGNGGYNHGVRPAVSLKPGTEYTSGDGSYTNPYVIE